MGWRASARQPGNHYVALDADDYSIYPGVINRRIEGHPELARVWDRHWTVNDAEHLAAANQLRRGSMDLVRRAPPVREHPVQVRDVST